MYACRVLQLSIVVHCLWNVGGRAVLEFPVNDTKYIDQKFLHLSVQLESYFKSAVQSVTKSMLPHFMMFLEDGHVSSKCVQSLTKYIMNLARAKMWAVQMLDATSKVPPGILIGTFSSFGSFDECLDVRVSRRNGELDFKGSSCAVELKLPVPPLSHTISLANIRKAAAEDSFRVHLKEAYEIFPHKYFKFIICVPSTCSLKDVQYIASRISNVTDFEIKVPECYEKQETEFHLIHIVVISSLGILLMLGIIGSILEFKKGNPSENIGTAKKVLISFSLSSNFKHLMDTSGGKTELRCIHGIRTLGMGWVILGHSYAFMDFDLLKDPINIQTWFGTLSFEVINNGWLGVEPFFLISGILISYSGLKTMVRMKGKLNIPLLILRRYLRLTPSVLLLMGIVFFMPLVSSGPFWYEQAEPQIETCRKYWWTTILYFSNWWGINKGCLQTTWYLAADFQLHIISLFILMLLFRHIKIAIGILLAAIILSCTAIGVQTWLWDLGATAHASTADSEQIFKSLDLIHIQTFTHLGPHCIGMVLGYYIYKYKDMKLSKISLTIGWCLSITLCISAVLGNHRFSVGLESSQYLTIMYASLYRCAFTFGVAWVLLACITGHGGPVNALLSSSIMIPVSRLTFMIYLVHPLVIWIKLGSLRERPFASHYEFVYTYITNAAASIILALPFYLLLEAPLSNLERLLNKQHHHQDNQETVIRKKSDIKLIQAQILCEFQPSHINNSDKSIR